MARDPDRNAYYTIGLPKNSAAYQRLLQDAAESNITIPSLIALRVADWYRLTASGALAQTSAGSATGAPETESERDEHVSQQTQAKANAEAAADAWL
jgi:hypothetical protein